MNYNSDEVIYSTVHGLETVHIKYFTSALLHIYAAAYIKVQQK